MIISSGIGSGLDIAGLVQQLVAAEAEPVEARLGIQEVRAQAKLSAFGSLKSALADFRDALFKMKDLDSFLSRSAAVSEDASFQATVSGTARPARYDIEVEQLAQAQKLSSAAFASADSTVGTGTLFISVGGASFGIGINEENNTLEGIRDTINDALDNTGVAATIVNADSGSYLTISSEKTGAANAITVTQTGGDGGLAALEYDPVGGLTSLTESTVAQDAIVRIDGLSVQSDSNAVAGAIEGVTLDLLDANPGQTYALQISNDEAAARESVDAFVEGYNQLVATFDSITRFNAESQEAGALLGDSTVRGIRDEVRRELGSITSGLGGNFSSLTEVGIELQLDGTLEVDSERLSASLSGEFTNFGQLFASSDGVAVRLYDRLEGYLAGDGLLERRTEGLDAQIEDINGQREASNQRLVALESRLLRQFNALDSLIGELTNTSNFLAQQLASLPGFSRAESGNG